MNYPLIVFTLFRCIYLYYYKEKKTIILQFRLSKRDLATISARAERHIGTQGGGMDQAIAFLGKAGKNFYRKR